jgi:hypothetical protein
MNRAVFLRCLQDEPGPCGDSRDVRDSDIKQRRQRSHCFRSLFEVAAL